MNPRNYLTAIRDKMQAQSLDAWIIPSADPHMSEYLPRHWQTRSEVSGFTGSVATLVIKAATADLWADSRYWEQAQQQLEGSGIVLQKLQAGRSHVRDLAETLPPGARVGIAPDMLSLAAKKQLEEAFAAKNIVLVDAQDLIDGIWIDRPALPSESIYPHPADYIGRSAAAKLADVRAVMAEKGAAAHLVSSLDDIAWLTNLRGSDVPYNPVFLSYVLILAGRATLFADETKLTPEARACLAEAGYDTAPYRDIGKAVAALEGSLLIDPAKTAVSTLRNLPASVRLMESTNPTTLFKSCKTAAEAAHIREAMREDGAALCRFYAELEQRLADGIRTTELDIDAMLLQQRSRSPRFVSPSFNTIAGFNANGALPHYAATAEAHSEIGGDGLLLIDSGAQYYGGTTDITRVSPVGTPSEAQKRDFTLVLKAHIALARAVFPENIPSPMIDALCRAPMWAAQCDYGHGTGHGVGYFLNVHEGPQVISYHAVPNANHAMKAGMVTSNEPGLYRPGKWGIRIENLVMNQEVDMPSETEFGRFLYFETLTLCPIDTRLVITQMLDAAETGWLNRYHREVRDRLLPLTDGAAREWLLARTEPL